MIVAIRSDDRNGSRPCVYAKTTRRSAFLTEMERVAPWSAEASASLDSRWDRIKVATFMGTDRPHVLRQAIHCWRNFGTVSLVGVYGGYLDKIPMGSAINRGLTFRMAQTPVQHYLPQLMDRSSEGRDRSVLFHHPSGITR
jgi:threonine dehydrogenase-like Zn-dependent dehydrogenase